MWEDTKWKNQSMCVPVAAFEVTHRQQYYSFALAYLLPVASDGATS